MKDVGNVRVLREKAIFFEELFGILDEIENFKVTRTRTENLAGKRQEKRNPSSQSSQYVYNPMSDLDVIHVGPRAPSLTRNEKRIASISDPAKLSSGGEQFYASFEQESQLFGNLFCRITLRSLFLDGIILEWVNRAQKPSLHWRHRYIMSLP